HGAEKSERPLFNWPRWKNLPARGRTTARLACGCGALGQRYGPELGLDWYRARQQRQRSFSDIQITALMALLADLQQRYKIPPRNILGHADIAPARKVDPSAY